jgi:hypothetical protein
MTLSPRLADGNTEPVYHKEVDCKLVGDSNPNPDDSQIVMSVICRNAAKWSNPPLDLTSSKAPFSWAVGRLSMTNNSFWSDDPAAPLRGHSSFSTFTMDMNQATVSSNPNSEIPTLGNKTLGASEPIGVTQTRNFASPAHGLLAIMGLVVLIPIDSALRLFIKTVKFHIFMMVLVSLLFIAGAGLGFGISGTYNRVSLVVRLSEMTYSSN